MRLLLDTTYVMPLAGIETERFGAGDFAELCSVEGVRLLLSPASLIEVKWLIIRETRGQPELRERLRRRYRDMLSFVLYGGAIELVPLLDEGIDEDENRLLDLGVRDYFDRVIFSAALHYADALLTEDEELRDVWRRTPDYRRSLTLYTWQSLKSWLVREGVSPDA